MLRALLFGIVAGVALPALVGCGSKDAPAAQPGAVAGKVLEVSGTVSVAGKPLAVGDPVKTDDTIETGADGNIAIELAHNQARWELGPNHKAKPTESPVWTAAKRGSAAQVDQDTSAAGRPAERSAADTATSSKDSAASDKIGAPPPPPPPAHAASAAPPSAQPAPLLAQPGAASAPEPRSPAPPPSREERKAGCVPGLKNPLEDCETSPAGGEAAARDGDAKALEDRDRAPQQNSKAKAAKPAARSADPLLGLASCVPAGTKITIKAHIANHVPSISFVGPVDATVKACVTAGAKKLSMPAATGDVELSLTR